LPIGALYLLTDGSTHQNAPRVEPVSTLDGIIGMVANTYVSRFLDKSMRAKELKELSQLVNQVAVRKVSPDREPSQLARLCRVILEDIKFKALTV
jgi:hypothetical protein